MTVRIGVIGVGALGFHHARILRDVPGARLVGIYDSDPARTKHVGDELGVPTFDSVPALLDQVDAVTVVVSTRAHARVAIPILERGIHTLIEKPLASTLAEADQLCATAKAHGAIIQTGHVERFNRAIRAAMPFVDHPRFLESDRLAPFTTRGADVAVVLDLMIHDIDLLHTLVGGAVTSVRAIGFPVLTPFVDMANARLEFATGAVANITASRVSKERMRKLRLFQRSGYLSLDLAAGTGELYRLRPGLDVEEFVKMAHGAGAQSLDAYVERVELTAPEGEPLRLELESFIDAIERRAPVVVSGEAGREALAIALAIEAEITRSIPALVSAPSAAARA